MTAGRATRTIGIKLMDLALSNYRGIHLRLGCWLRRPGQDLAQSSSEGETEPQILTMALWQQITVTLKVCLERQNREPFKNH